jgi:hypothetical protein
MPYSSCRSSLRDYYTVILDFVAATPFQEPAPSPLRLPNKPLLRSSDTKTATSRRRLFDYWLAHHSWTELHDMVILRSTFTTGRLPCGPLPHCYPFGPYRRRRSYLPADWHQTGSPFREAPACLREPTVRLLVGISGLSPLGAGCPTTTR